MSRERIVRAALALIDRVGLDAFTMRRLGAALGVEAMAIYKHIPSKSAVLDAVIDALLDELNRGRPPSVDARGAIETLARRHRALERSHPGAYALLSGMPGRAYPKARPVVEGILGMLADEGYTPEQAARHLRVVLRFTIGFTVTRPAETSELGADDALAPVMRGLADPAEDDVLFELGLTALLDGLPPPDPGP